MRVSDLALLCATASASTPHPALANGRRSGCSTLLTTTYQLLAAADAAARWLASRHFRPRVCGTDSACAYATTARIDPEQCSAVS